MNFKQRSTPQRFMHTVSNGGEVQYILDDFHRVHSPRIMTEEYFDMVFEKFDILEEEGPLQ